MLYSVAGLDWVAGQASSTGNPTVINMSLGGGVSTPLDDAVAYVRYSRCHIELLILIEIVVD
jgi:cerevisin